MKVWSNCDDKVEARREGENADKVMREADAAKC